MVLAMTRPTKHPKTGVYLYRQRVPRDVLPVAKGQQVTVTIDGKSFTLKVGSELKVSLRTKDGPKAKELAAEAQSEFNRIWDSFRGGAETLTNKQCVALAGEVYSAFKLIEDDPGPPELWQRVQGENATVQANPLIINPLAIRKEPQDRREQRFGPFVDVVLRKHHLTITNGSRLQLLAHVSRAMDEAAALLERRASGDYRPDTNEERFPEFIFPQASSVAKATREANTRVTFDQIIDAEAAYRSQGRETKPFPDKTISQYKSRCREFSTYRGKQGKDASTVTLADLESWVEHLQKKTENTNRTIVDKAKAVQTVLRWGTARFRHVKALETALSDVSKFRPPRFKRKASDISAIWFEEAPTILTAARLANDPRCRWLPWLAAYTGARISELDKLEREDFAEHEGIWYFWITDTNGRQLKNESSKRIIPVHPALIAEGFRGFVDSKASGRLFAKGAADAVRRWFHAIGPFHEGVRPIHGWRHLFEDLCIRFAVPQDVKLALTGRSSGKSDQSYGKTLARLPGLHKGLCLIEPFDLD